MPSNSAGEPLEKLIAGFLNSIPETWAEFDPATLTGSQEKAIFLLTGAGLVERRATVRLRMFGHPTAVEATFTMTGECGFLKAIEPVVADVWNDWKEQFEKRNAGEQKDAPAFHAERIGKQQWRLTDQGILARTDLEQGDSSTVFDFVLKRNFFDGTPKLLSDGRISQRLPIAGNGRLERMQRVQANGGPTGTSIANWGEGAAEFAAAFAQFFKAAGPQASTANATHSRNGAATNDPTGGATDPPPASLPSGPRQGPHDAGPLSALLRITDALAIAASDLHFAYSDSARARYRAVKELAIPENRTLQDLIDDAIRCLITAGMPTDRVRQIERAVGPALQALANANPKHACTEEGRQAMIRALDSWPGIAKEIRSEAAYLGLNLADRITRLPEDPAAIAEFIRPQEQPPDEPRPARESEGAPSKPTAKRKMSQPEIDAAVADYLRRKAVGNVIAITRDGVAEAIGCSTGAVSNSPTWKAFQARRSQLREPRGRQVQMTDGLLSVLPADPDEELVRLTDEQTADAKRDERRANRRRHDED